MIKILISDKYAQEGIDKLSAHEGFQVDVKTGMTPEELQGTISDYDALLVRSATKPDSKILDAAENLKIIVRAGEGTDNIDKAHASKKDIVVENTPGQNSHAVAELTIGLMFSLARHIPRACATMNQGKWEKKQLKGTELKGKIFGLIGAGKIGKDVGNTAAALGMKVICYEKFQDVDFKQVEMDELLIKSDYVSVHVPLTKETENMIGKAELAKMKPTAYIINCARGGIINEEELADAVSAGRLAGAGVDVYCTEPPPADAPLLNTENIICTPHLGASTMEAQVNCALSAANQVIEYFDNGAVINRVN
ncbi:MAG: hydroxyacid dehydrogenase [Elusimicrobiota bacterium]|nr:hydroxyacid dehydrogenase [Elusimicrobiota bacterium]